MNPGYYNFICPQGATFDKELTYRIDEVVVDLTGYTARMQVRESYRSKTYLINLTTENGGIILGGESGTIRIYIDADVTRTFKDKVYLYDIELVSNGYVYRLLQGKFTVTPEVTR